MAILGVNAWLVLLLWPLLLPFEHGVAEVAIAAAVLGVLAVGVLLLGRNRHTAAAWVLLCAFPALAIGAIAWRPEAWNQEAHIGLALVIQVLSLLAYAAVGASATSSATVSASVTLRRQIAIEPTPWDEHHGPPRRLQRVLTAIVGIGAFAVTVLSPTLGGWAALERAWGETAREGGVLTAVVGASVAVAVVTLFGGALRSTPERSVSSHERALRVASLLLAAAFGAATWFLIQE